MLPVHISVDTMVEHVCVTIQGKYKGIPKKVVYDFTALLGSFSAGAPQKSIKRGLILPLLVSKILAEEDARRS